MGVRCVVGLGNPGPRYEWTRHNAGFWIVDRLSREAGATWSRAGNAVEADARVHDVDLLLLKPLTYMNRSGDAVLGAMERRGLMPSELLVVVDDVALPEGRIRLRASGSAGGHRGLESIEQTLATRDYPRLRIGVGGAPEGEDLADYVLRPIPAPERERFASIVGRAADAAKVAIDLGVPLAMNRVNAAGDADASIDNRRS